MSSAALRPEPFSHCPHTSLMTGAPVPPAQQLFPAFSASVASALWHASPTRRQTYFVHSSAAGSQYAPVGHCMSDVHLQACPGVSLHTPLSQVEALSSGGPPSTDLK